MIDLKSEKPMSLAQAAELIPPSRSGRPYHVSTLTRAIVNGTNGVKLEAIRLGGRWLTSVEALQRWADAQTALVTGEPVHQTSNTRRRAAASADADLEKSGW